MVTPPALIAATPVGATTIILLGELCLRSRRKVVFPVPAFKDIDSGLLEKFPGKIHLGVVRHVLYSFYDLKIPI